MKKLFLASSFADVADLFVQFSDDDCAGKSITFIPTASLTEEVTFYVSAGKEALEQRGMTVDELEISTATYDEIKSKLQDNHAIYITGGNTFFLLQELKRTGADLIITEQITAGKPYIGESAGAMVLSKDIEYVQGMDDSSVATKLDSFSSLGVVDFYPLPHYTNYPFVDAVEKVIRDYSRKIKLRPFSNAQAIVVKGNEVELVSA